MFDADLFHMGGDEVYKSCWMNNPTILKSIGNQSFMDLWGKFQMNALERLHKANSLAHIRPIVWTSGMTATPEGRKYLNASEYIIQVWETGKAYDVFANNS
jgi:hexosaminidase